MTLVEAQTRVRHLVGQTSTTNTVFDNAEFIKIVLDQGRRSFATILPEEKLPKLVKSSDLGALSSEVGSYPADFLRPLKNPHVTITTAAATYVGVRIPNNERWRLKWIDNTTFNSDLTDEYYYYERSDGVIGLHATVTITAIGYQYLKTPAVMSTTTADSQDLPLDVEDLVIDFAFKKCMGTTRGNLELAKFLAREQGIVVGERQ